MSPVEFDERWVFPEPNFTQEVDLIMVRKPINIGKPDLLMRPPLEPLVQGRRCKTARMGDTITYL